MNQSLTNVTLLVKDYDEAITFYTQHLNFILTEDTPQPELNRRWVTVSPPGENNTRLVLTRATTPEQHAIIGKQAAGSVFLFLSTDDIWRDYHNMKNNITFTQPPTTAPYGTVAIFKDLYGNLWDLIQPAQ